MMEYFYKYPGCSTLLKTIFEKLDCFEIFKLFVNKKN